MKKKQLVTKHNASVKIKKSYTGLGLFAADTIKRNQFIIEYTGKKLTNREADDKKGKYLFEVNDRYTIDGTGRGNIARYINHSCDPNALPEIERGKVMIYATKRIELGEEITYDYGEDYCEEFLKPCLCKVCGKYK